MNEIVYPEGTVVVNPYQFKLMQAMRKYGKPPKESARLVGLPYNHPKHYHAMTQLTRVGAVRVTDRKRRRIHQYELIDEHKILMLDNQQTNAFYKAVVRTPKKKRKGKIIALGNGGFLILGDNYVGKPSHPLQSKPRITPEDLAAADQLREDIKNEIACITDAKKSLIHKWIKEDIPRSEIAEKLNINKLVLNFYLMWGNEKLEMIENENKL